MPIEHEDDLFDLDDDDSLEGADLPEGLAGFDMDEDEVDEIDDYDGHHVDDFSPELGTLDDDAYDEDADQDQGDDEEEPEEGSAENDNEPLAENELINELLTAKGIKDQKIQYEAEDGTLEEVDFYSLPKEDQLAILNSSDKDINYGLADNEIQAVNFLRENGVTLEETVEYFKRQAVQEYIDSQNIAGIQVDQYSDEELFAIDLRAKYEDFTEEEIEIELSKQLEHPDLFKRKVDKLRTEYQEIEQQQLEQTRVEQEALETQKFTELQENLITVADAIEDIGGLDLDVDDKNEVLNFILEKDMNGASQFIKSLDSPQQLFELAWFATKGKEAFEILHDHYKKEIDKVSKASYTKGKEEVTKVAPSKQSERKSFVRKGAQRVTGKPNTLHIDDINID